MKHCNIVLIWNRLTLERPDRSPETKVLLVAQQKCNAVRREARGFLSPDLPNPYIEGMYWDNSLTPSRLVSYYILLLLQRA